MKALKTFWIPVVTHVRAVTLSRLGGWQHPQVMFSVRAFPGPLYSGTMPSCGPASPSAPWALGKEEQANVMSLFFPRHAQLSNSAGSPCQVTHQQNGPWKDQSQPQDPFLLLHKSEWKGCSKTQNIPYWSPGNLTSDKYGLLNLIITQGYISFALGASSKMKFIYLLKFNVFLGRECYNFQGRNAIRWSLTMFLLACIFLKCFAFIFF